ncbi:unnamed protein product [Prorocentrum cordatum]|uniref:Uncharacterized protein n=1 Tax=Prorocentrum cordatum TaxID=2364126 RepID=A0ABN9PQA2_9DINO|nr:unnamed protein product [Polarella glacialis]
MGARERSAAAAAAQGHEDDSMGSGGEQVAAQPRRRAKLDTSDKVSCGLCGAKRCDPNVQCPEAPNDAGEVRRVGYGCASCWGPFQRVFSNETTWTKHCARQKGDAKCKKRVENAKDISKDPEKASFEQEEVNIVAEQCYTTIGNYVCIKPEHLEQQAGGGVTVGAADVLTQRVTVGAPLTKQKLKTICVAHPERPPVEVQTFTTVKCQKVARTLPRRAALADAQAQVEMKKALAEVTKLLPVPLRGHEKPPDVESLVNQLQGAKSALGAGGLPRGSSAGEVVPPAVGATGALADGAAGGAVAACGSDVADGRADGGSGDEQGAAAEVASKGRGVEINGVEHLAKVDAAIALHKGIATMTARQRAEQIEIIGNGDVLDASGFLDQLICKVVGEADSGDDVARAILPWAPADADSSTTFQLKRPRISFPRMSNADKVVACRGSFFNAFLAEVAAKCEESVNLAREGAAELRALLVISNTSPNAVDQVTDGANVREMLNGTFSKDRSLFRDSLMSNTHWACLTTEYLDHALSDLQVGPDIVTALAMVSVGSDLAAMVSASSRLKGWIEQSRAGATADLEKAFAQWVVNVTSAGAAPTFTCESVGQVREVTSNRISAAKVKKSFGVLQVAALAASEESMELAQAKIGVEKKRDSLLDRMRGCTAETGHQWVSRGPPPYPAPWNIGLQGDVGIRGMFELKTVLSDLKGEVFGGESNAKLFEDRLAALAHLIMTAPSEALGAEDAAEISQQVETAMLCANVVRSDSRTKTMNNASKLLGHYKVCCNVATNLLSLTDIGDVGQQELITRLRGGMGDGASWKDGLADGDSYDEVHTRAKTTLFKGKNGTLLNKTLGDYKCATDEARKHSRKCNIMDRVNDLTEPFKATLAEANAAINEAALMKLMRKKPYECRDAVARELDAVADRGVSAAKLLAQIYEVAVATKPA